MPFIRQGTNLLPRQHGRLRLQSVARNGCIPQSEWQPPIPVFSQYQLQALFHQDAQRDLFLACKCFGFLEKRVRNIQCGFHMGTHTRQYGHPYQ